MHDTVYADLTQLRLTRMHARGSARPSAACAGPADVSAPAHHYILRAASADSALRGRGRLLRHQGGRTGGPPLPYDAAVWTAGTGASAAFARIPGSESERAEQQADLLGRLLRAQIRAGRIAAARATRQRVPRTPRRRRAAMIS